MWYNVRMKCIFIYNPNSGKGKIAKKMPYICKMLHKKYDVVDTYATKSKDDFLTKLKEIARAYDCIVFAGGDGTFNDVLSALADFEPMPLLGYIPSGTANDVAHSIGIPRGTIKGALKVILSGKKKMLDCMKINGNRYAMYTVAAGAFTSSTYSTPQDKKRSMGMAAYVADGIKANIPFPNFSVEVETKHETVNSGCALLLVMNGKCAAGVKFNHDGSMCDGKLECAVVTQVRRPRFWERVAAFFRVIRLFLFGCRFKERDVIHLQSDKFQITVPEYVVWTFDGEKGVNGSIEVEVLKSKVPLIVPKNNKNI